MTTDLDRLTRHFCKTLYGYTGGVPMTWRSILMVSAVAGIRAASTQKLIVARGVKLGWLIEQGGRSVALTDEGRILSADLVEQREAFRRARSRQDSDSRLADGE
jgi:hypothetical protein